VRTVSRSDYAQIIIEHFLAASRISLSRKMLYQQPMAETPFPRHLIVAGAVVCGVLLALAFHMIGQRFGLDLAGLWREQTLIPAGAALAWWLIATVAFVGGFVTASLMSGAATGTISRPMWQFLIGVLVLVLAGAGQVASGPPGAPTVSGMLAGLSALALGAAMAFCGAHFAARKV
jgi:small-conductance mechanosensitive channel